MTKRTKKTSIRQSKGTKVKKEAFRTSNSRRTNQILISFEYCDDRKHCLCELNKNELKEITKTFKILNTNSWLEARQHTGLQIKALKDINPPSYISEDVKLNEIRFNQKGRLHGFHMDGIYYVIWFDKNHEVTAKKN